jgi:hypothetical protein
MNSLPQDILDDILSYLLPAPKRFEIRDPYDSRAKAPQRLAPLATVSRRMQASVERLLFRFLRITSDELPRFEQLLTPPRAAALLGLIFVVVLPPYDSIGVAETPADRAANDERYTDATLSLFRLVRRWEDRDGITSRLRLYLNHPESPSDNPYPYYSAPWSIDYDKSRQPGDSIHEGRYMHSHVRLLAEPDDLPVLGRVTRLTMTRPKTKYGYRNLHPKVGLQLAARLPNLEGLRLSLDDDERRFPEIRRQNRDEATAALRALNLPCLKTADVEFHQTRYRNEAVSPDPLHPLSSPDPLSAAFFDFSQNLISLTMTGVFDQSSLHPLRSLADVHWPRLRSIDINLHPTTPSGQWYFTGTPDTNLDLGSPSVSKLDPGDHARLHEENFSHRKEAEYALMLPWNAFRTTVAEDTLVPYIQAYAEALSAMPQLRAALLSCQLEAMSPLHIDDGEPALFSIAYFAPCGSAQRHPPRFICPNCQRGVSRQLVTMLLGWRPADDLADKLRAIGSAYHPEPMIERDMLDFLREYENDLDDEDDDDGD